MNLFYGTYITGHRDTGTGVAKAGTCRGATGSFNVWQIRVNPISIGGGQIMSTNYYGHLQKCFPSGMPECLNDGSLRSRYQGSG